MRFGRRPLTALWWAATSNGAVSSFLLQSPISASVSSTTSTFLSNRPPFGLRNHHSLSSTVTSRKMSSSSSEESSFKQTSRIALLQFKVTENKETNHQTCTDFIKRAAKAGAQMVVLPEIWNSPYATSAFGDYAETLPEPHDDPDSITSPSTRLLLELAKLHNLWIVGGSIPEVVSDKELYNTCLVVSPQGEVVAKHRKVHLFDVDVPGGIVFFESDTLSSGSSYTCFDSGKDAFGMVGVGICYDIRFPEYALVLTQQHGCKLLIYPGAFNMTTGPAHWELLIRARAVDNQCFVCMASPARSEKDDNSKYPHYTAWGHSTIVSPWGEIVATTQHDEDVVVADLNFDLVDEMRQAIPCGNQKRHDMYQIQEINKKT